MTRRRGPVRWLDRLGLNEPEPGDAARWEVEHHIAEVADRLVEAGWDEAAARREAERRFGDATRYVPAMTNLERGRVAMEKRMLWWDLVRDGFGSVVRTGRRYPGFTAGVVLTLGLGIGANATMYGIVDRLLLQPPALIEQPDAVKRVFLERESFRGGMFSSSSATYPDYLDLKAHSGMDVAAYTSVSPLTIGSGEEARKVRATRASASFFPVLGVSPRLGRFYTEEESRPESALTAVLSEEYWARAHGRSPDVLGRTLEIQGQPATIIGVAPAGFTGLDLAPVDLWLPLEPVQVLQNGGDGCLTSRGCWWMRIVARLHDGVEVASAEAEATRLHLNGRREMIEEGRYVDTAHYILGPVIAAEGPEASSEARVTRWLAGVSVVVLLIACANVANLLMARGTRQRREISVRLALGASRARVVAQTMIESVILALGGAAVALVVARWGGAIVRSTLLPGVAFPAASWSGRLMVFTGVAAVLSGLVAGLAPALHGRRTSLAGALGEGARGASGARSRLRGALTVAQAAMSVVLLVGAGLFVRSLTELRSLDLGLDVDHLLVVTLEAGRSGLTPDETRALYAEAGRRAESLPGVISTAATGVPFQWGLAEALRVQGLDSIPRLPGGGPYYYPVTPGYFETVGLDLVKGRTIGPEDGADSEKVALVSQTMAETLWPTADPLGQCLLVGTDAEQCTTVVGVVQDAARSGYRDEPFMAYYLPDRQADGAPQGMYVRTAGSAAAASADVARALRAFSPSVRYANVRTLQDMLDPQARAWTLGATMFSIFGLLALCLAAIGLYSVLAFDVAQRTRELGIRAALGAERGRLLRSVVGQGGRLAGAGVALGVAVSWLAAPYAADLLFQVSPRDPLILLVVATLLAVVGVAASLVPGLRATNVAPTEALRAD